MEENLDELHQQLKDMKVAKEFKDTIKDTRNPKAEVVEPVAEPKVIVKEIHHHYAEPKSKKATGEKAPRKPRVKKEVAEPKPVSYTHLTLPTNREV